MAAARSRRGARTARRRGLAPLLPALLFLTAFFLLPLLFLASRSVLDPHFTLRHYHRMLVVPQYLQVLANSFEVALVVTGLCLLIGYPVAYVVTTARPAWRHLLLVLILLPFWTNVLVRAYSWMLILQTTGIVNRILVGWLGLLSTPVELMYNFTGVVIGMVHFLLPLMVLILYSVMQAIDRRLVRAAEGLGATPWQAFRRVFVPLSLPGVRAASLLIFILALGFFVTPALLGGRRQVVVAMLVETNFTEVLNWGFGSALAVTLLVVTLAGVLLYQRLLGRGWEAAG
jgi:ABC-type spermidine/putrescine transport system permease subunit I